MSNSYKMDDDFMNNVTQMVYEANKTMITDRSFSTEIYCICSFIQSVNKYLVS